MHICFNIKTNVSYYRIILGIKCLLCNLCNSAETPLKCQRTIYSSSCHRPTSYIQVSTYFFSIFLPFSQKHSRLHTHQSSTTCHAYLLDGATDALLLMKCRDFSISYTNTTSFSFSALVWLCYNSLGMRNLPQTVSHFLLNFPFLLTGCHKIG